ncbi:zwei Ig domain protein zig-8-like [Mytilus edulis]|uniref:zwei Ig domain protein zig-8-like n=1 Tax=Mytilus edulis TaxID=6550 RepID=UPI0039F07252
MCRCKKNYSICHFLCNFWNWIIWTLLLGYTEGYDPRGRYRNGERLVPIQPSFAPSEQNFTVFEGHTAVLTCVVENLGTKTVVWRKMSDTNPLTVGKMTYVSDSRVQIHHIIHRNNWNLHIRDAKDSDSGTYECQISTKDRNLRRTVHLQVLERPQIQPEPSGIKITGNFHVEIGDTLHLICNATEATTPLEDIAWFKDGDELEKNTRATIYKALSLKGKSIKSDLYIDKVEMDDSGYYLCRAGALTTHKHAQVLNTAGNKDKRGTLVDTSLGYREGLDKKNASASIHGKVVLFIAFFVELLKHIFS